ncbi:cell wall hydrolase [Aneurinibacillus sp. Ricciae_BoGa-3]|uniref:cell wall hydrolase n=1 Tax=Aneurinibacillus sp. Ricciae_BoGa-3 TaxID=3022697 RepID=UPI002341B71B|nr:cell wall hydrolase [Aneurinibacillus sp. Ricciae_BoGa-3]WCK55209.1 cell wall hydrolase [Aneurinibacillus sp. Ricciae_BoGa-3]
MGTRLFFSLFVITGCLFFSIGQVTKVQASTLTYGSKSQNVRYVQLRLQNLGYFHTNVTGFYGSQTRQAVLQFQRDNHMRPDGRVGPATWTKLQHAGSRKQSEIDQLAHLIYGEARGESYWGQVAVGAVVMNRLKSPYFPHSIPGVIFQPGAFTAVADRQYNLTPNFKAYRAALAAFNGADPTRHSLYYFNPKLATSRWIWSRPRTVRIGKHVFAH